MKYICNGDSREPHYIKPDNNDMDTLVIMMPCAAIVYPWANDRTSRYTVNQEMSGNGSRCGVNVASRDEDKQHQPRPPHNKINA